MLSFFSGKQWIICLHASWPDGGNWLILGPTRNEKMQQRPTHRSASPLRVTRKHRCSEGRTAVTPHWKQTHHLSRRRHACHSDRVDFHFQNKKKKCRWNAKLLKPCSNKWSILQLQQYFLHYFYSIWFTLPYIIPSFLGYYFFSLLKTSRSPSNLSVINCLSFTSLVSLISLFCPSRSVFPSLWSSIITLLHPPSLTSFNLLI